MQRGQAPCLEIDVSISGCLAVGLAAALMVGCSHDRSQVEDTRAPSARVIIKFVASTQGAPGVIRMRAAGSPIVLRRDRAMSGGAYVYEGRLTQTQAATVIHRLNERPNVRYAHADRKLKLWETPTEKN